MFNKKFKIVEIHKSGAVVTHYLKGKRNEVEKDIKTFINKSELYEMIGKDGMIVWRQCYTIFSFFNLG